MNTVTRGNDENHINSLVSKLQNVNWGKIAKYAVPTAVGAIALGFAGNEFGRDIADLLGVKSQLMGIETEIAKRYITGVAGVVGAAIGYGAAHLHERKNINNE